MRDKQVIEMLRSYRPEAPAEQWKKDCIRGLPEIGQRHRIWPLIRLQATFLYGRLCLLLAGIYLCMVLAVYAVTPQQLWGDPELCVPVLSGLSLAYALAAAILLIHALLSAETDMRELENCCRYSYGQIVMARLILAAGAAILFDAAVILMLWPKVGADMVYLNGRLVFPVICGAAAALNVSMRRGAGRNVGLVAGYAAGALAGQGLVWYVLPRVSDNLFLPAVLSAVLFGALCLQGKYLMRRRWYDEAFDV